MDPEVYWRLIPYCILWYVLRAQVRANENVGRFWDIQHSKPATIDDAHSGRYQLFPLHHYHIIHCLYQWRRLHLAIIEHRHIDNDVYSYGHTLHCTRLIMGWPHELQYGKNSSTQTERGKYIEGRYSSSQVLILIL